MFSGIVSRPGPPVPPCCPTVSQTIQCYNSSFAPNPHPIYSASPSLLPPPTLWTRGVVTCFFSGECGLLVNSWATIHSEGKSSQDTVALLEHAATDGERHEYRKDWVLTKVCILTQRAARDKLFTALKCPQNINFLKKQKFSPSVFIPQ